ncbi:type IV pilus biogenesis/stability protein PilW [Methylophaga thalassica]|jgi:type IV pilus assembly protein PilF|uniref:Type IV pilus biogenesis/stability protein PilW n=1 Tax=Methylophaga thalassica TaxID=40223 RepID=A0ABQ5TTS6_9GAMM|nr:type IV pilus biogenesis/stability protein PilW [Methylophaga thalassica]GLP99572.1 type IV pilus biogenesis/stability protein PilW [Methylophaga thalassica]
MSNRVSFALILIAFFVLTACNSTGGTRSEYVAKDAKAADINMRLGLNYMQRGDYKIALEKLEKALKQNPNLSSAHNTIALLYQYLGENDKAEEHFERAVQLEPDYSEAQNNYGVFLCQQSRYDEAEKRFLKALENPLYSSAALAYENAGLCTEKAGATDRAEGYFRKALQMAPRLPKSLLKMASISYQQQNYLQARGYIQRFQQAASWTSQALLLGIKIETKLADKNAVSSYKLILRSRFPDSDEMRIVNQGLVE